MWNDLHYQLSGPGWCCSLKRLLFFSQGLCWFQDLVNLKKLWLHLHKGHSGKEVSKLINSRVPHSHPGLQVACTPCSSLWLGAGPLKASAVRLQARTKTQAVRYLCSAGTEMIRASLSRSCWQRFLHAANTVSPVTASQLLRGSLYPMLVVLPPLQASVMSWARLQLYWSVMLCNLGWKKWSLSVSDCLIYF